MGEYVGLDVSKADTAVCVMDESASIIFEGKCGSDPHEIFKLLRKETLCPELIVLETGTLSKWLQRGLRDLGLPAEVIDARHAHGVMGLQLNKSDASDAVLLAKIAQTGFYKPVTVGSLQSQERQTYLKARKQLIKSARSTENTVRGLLGSFGVKMPTGVPKFINRVRLALDDHPNLKPSIEPLLAAIAALREQLGVIDKRLLKNAKSDAACQLLMTVPGVGHLTAQAFVASIDDPARFTSSRNVGAYFGLTTRRYQSGERDVSGRISKIGDSMTRSLLYSAASAFLLHVKRPHPVKAWANRIKKRSGHRKAVVALARKMSVIMHKMLVTGEPFHWPETAK